MTSKIPATILVETKKKEIPVLFLFQNILGRDDLAISKTAIEKSGCFSENALSRSLEAPTAVCFLFVFYYIVNDEVSSFG